MKDLFGREITVEQALLLKNRKTTQPKGYAAQPGSGPKGETCKTCAHLVRKRYSRYHLKCWQNRGRWTNGPGSDIKASAPACRLWEKREGKPKQLDGYYGGEIE